MRGAEGLDAVPSGAALVVAADSARARLFQAREPAAPLQEVAGLVNPEARLHEGDLVEDSAARRGTRPTQAKRSAHGGESARDHRAEDFAAAICEHAARELRERRADRLYLVADPEFLGLLRKRMDTSLSRRVAGTVAKSIAGKPPSDIRAALPSRL